MDEEVRWDGGVLMGADGAFSPQGALTDCPSRRKEEEKKPSVNLSPCVSADQYRSKSDE